MMPRISYQGPTGEPCRFDRNDATRVSGDVDYWNGQNRISRVTGSQWLREDLWRTKEGAWVIQRDNRDGRGGAEVGVTWVGITRATAEAWLRRQDLYKIADYYFGITAERNPGEASAQRAVGWVLLVGDPVRGVTAYAVESADDPDIEERFANETWWVVPVHRIRDRDDDPQRGMSDDGRHAHLRCE